MLVVKAVSPPDPATPEKESPAETDDAVAAAEPDAVNAEAVEEPSASSGDQSDVPAHDPDAPPSFFSEERINLPAIPEPPKKEIPETLRLVLILIAILLGGSLAGAWIGGGLKLENLIQSAGYPAQQAAIPIDQLLQINNINLTREVMADPEGEEDVPLLLVSGRVQNLSEQVQSVPDIRIALNNGEGVELYHWTVTADVIRLAPGQVTGFETETQSPPVDARKLSIRFVDTADQ